MLESTLPKSLRLIFSVLKFLGCWQLDNPSPLKLLFYRLYTVILLSIFFVVLFAAQLIYIVQVLNDLEKLTEAMFLPLTYAAYSFKMGNFFLIRSRLNRLILYMKQDIFRPKNYYQKQLLTERTDTFKVTYMVFLLMAWGTILLWAIFPLLERNSGVKKLPIEAWYPFDNFTTTLYLAAYIHQIIAITINATINISFDCIPPGFMAYISAQLELLSDSFENIYQYVEDNLRSKYENAGLLLDDEQSIKEEFNEELKREQIHCVEHHLNILRLANEINTMFNFSTFGQLAISVFTICVTMFELTLVSPMSLQFMSMVLYQGCMLMELFLFCQYGNEISLKSANLLASVYQSDWTDCPMSYKRNVLIIMIRMHKPMRMYAGNFFALSLQTFVKILRSSWSYFAVLQQVHSK